MNNVINTLKTNNLEAAKTAAVLTAGAIANKQLVKLVSSHSPLMVKGYVDTPVGKLLIANVAAQVIAYARPNDKKLAQLSEGMIVNAYQDLIATIDLDQLIDEFLNAAPIKKALKELDRDSE
jgi:hypothetical protein